MTICNKDSTAPAAKRECLVLELSELAQDRPFSAESQLELNDLLSTGSYDQLLATLRHLRSTEGTSQRTAIEIELERIAANADPATVEAFDKLVQKPRRESSYRETNAEPRHSDLQCAGVQLLRRVGGNLEVLVVSCRRRSCPACGQSWLDTKEGKLLAATADFETLNVALIPDNGWRTVQTRLRRRGHGWCSIPVPEGRLVVTDDQTLGETLSYADVFDRARSALAHNVEKAGKASSDRRNVSLSASWKAASDAAAFSEEEDQDEIEKDVEYFGVIGTSLTHVRSTAERHGGKLAPVGPLETDPDELSRWRVVGIPMERLWAFKAGIRLTTFEELGILQTERAFERRRRKAPEPFSPEAVAA